MRLIWILVLQASLWADPTAILSKRCLSCHNEAAKMGNLSLVSRLSAERVLGGKLLDRINKGEMPPGAPLPAEEREELKRWIEAGAPWEASLAAKARPRANADWWSLQPIRRHAGSIDTFIEKSLAAKQLRLSPPADRRTLLRRVSFDLTGLPPTPAELASFLADSSPDAYEKVIDRLLASPAYGERWGRHWLDVIRYGESHGYEQNHVRPNAWPFRDYVIEAFNRDLPFNQFIRHQLAGDLIAPDDPQVSVATGFLVAGPHDTVGNSNLAAQRQQRADDLDDMVNATASAFLGLTVNCARCHDHKFDPIAQADYYRLASIFAGVNHADRPIATATAKAEREALARPLEEEAKTLEVRLKGFLESTQSNRKAAEAQLRGRLRPPVSPFGSEESWTPATARFLRINGPEGFPGGIDEVEVFDASGKNLAPTARLKVSSTRIADGNPDAYHSRHLTDGNFDKRWFAETNAPASIELQFPRPVKLVKAAWSTDRPKAFQGRFQQNTLSNYTIEISRDGRRWTRIASGEGRLPHRPADLDRLITLEALSPADQSDFKQTEARLAAITKELKQLPSLPQAFAGTFKQPSEPVYLLRGGNVMQRGAEIAPASLSTIPSFGFELPVDAPEGQRRLQFADWLADSRNPLTPRVIVNRLWHYHFGQGIVGTPSDFGFNGERPSHPELLDYLSQRLLDSGWRLKPLHREILLSATYRQASTFNEAAARIDADARLLWRFPPQRLSAEALRDTMLSVAGVLNPQRGGPSFRLYKYTVDNVATYFPLDRFAPSTYRRSVYAESARSIRTELLSVFDCPDSSLPEPRRVVTTSPLQALSLLNHSFTLDMARALEQRTKGSIQGTFELAYARTPTPAEAAAAEKLIQQHGFIAFARAIFNSSEFLYVD